MYILKTESQKKPKIAQMELLDFVGSRRQVIFNADDPKDVKKCERVLKPKGIRRAKKRTKKQKPQRQMEISQLMPEMRVLDSITKDLGKANKKSSAKTQIPQKLSPKAPESKKLIPPAKTNIPSPAKPSRTLITPPSPTPNKTQEKIKQEGPILQEEIIDEFGHGGDLEISCPFCSDSVNFYYNDIDDKRLKSIRICGGCEAVLRVSIRDFNRTIFNDLQSKVSGVDLVKITRRSATEIVDEYNNAIIAYGFQNIR